MFTIVLYVQISYLTEYVSTGIHLPRYDIDVLLWTNVLYWCITVLYYMGNLVADMILRLTL